MVDVAEKRMTVAEFLTWDDGTDTPCELVRGKVVAMAPPTASHSVIVANVGAALAGSFAPYYGGMSAGVILHGRDDTFYVADQVVSGTPLQADMSTIPQPVLIIEVLSPMTAEHDRGGKLDDYRRISSVQEIALVASEQRDIVIWRRRGTRWKVEHLIGDAALELETVGAKIPFAAIYADSGI